MPTAIEELLRFDTPSTLFERWVLEPIEVAGVELPRGAEVALLFGSANRDPAAFDRPDDLDLGRAARTRTSRSGPGSTTASGRRWPGSSSGSRSRRCSGGCRGSSWSSRRAGSRPSSCAASRPCASVSDRRCATSRSATRTRSGPPSRPAERWPDQLVAALGADRADARARRQPRRQRLHLGRPHPRRAAGAAVSDPEFVTVLIGVNDVVQGVAAGALRGERRDDPRHAPGAPCPPTGSSPSPSRTTRSRRPVPTTATRASNARDRRRQRDDGAARRRARDRIRRHLRPVTPRGRGPVAGGGRWAPPERRPVRAVGRADPAGRQPSLHRALTAPGPSTTWSVARRRLSSWSRSSEIPKWWAISW